MRGMPMLAEAVSSSGLLGRRFLGRRKVRSCPAAGGSGLAVGGLCEKSSTTGRNILAPSRIGDGHCDNHNHKRWPLGA
jgi:hypothetical protein